jgi:hypothetical protein
MRSLSFPSTRWAWGVLIPVVIAFGAGIGYAAAYFPFYLSLLVIGLLGLVLAFFVAKIPHLTVCLFWVVFVLQSTVFEGFLVQGLYYPLYLIMLFNFIVALAQGTLKRVRSVLVLYSLFLVAVLLSLFNVAVEVDFDLFQKLFFQFRSEKSFDWLTRVQIWTGAAVSVWVIMTSLTNGVGERGGISVNQNNVSETIVFGLIPLIANQLFSRTKIPLLRLLNLAMLAVGIYALLILASRGFTIGFVFAVIVMLARILLHPRRSIPILVVLGLAAGVIISLPGGDNLIARFNSGDMTTANGRLPLWSAAIQEIRNATPPKLLFGNGFDYTYVAMSKVIGFRYSVHNAYLQFVLDFGLIGLSLFLLLHLLVLRTTWRTKHKLAMYASGQVTFLLFVNLTSTDPDSFLYWVVLGTALSIGTFKLQEQPRPT